MPLSLWRRANDQSNWSRRRVVDLLRAQDAAGTSHAGDPARQVDGVAVVVAGALQGRSARDAGAEARQLGRLGGLEQRQRDRHHGRGIGTTNIAASPIVLTSRTGGSVTSVASSASLLARLPSSWASIWAPRRVNPTMSTKHTVISWSPATSPDSRSAELSIPRRTLSREVLAVCRAEHRDRSPGSAARPARRTARLPRPRCPRARGRRPRTRPPWWRPAATSLRPGRG